MDAYKFKEKIYGNSSLNLAIVATMLLPEARLPHPPFLPPPRAATYVSCASDDLARGVPGSGTVVVEELVVVAENAPFEMNDFFSFHASLLGIPVDTLCVSFPATARFGGLW